MVREAQAEVRPARTMDPRRETRETRTAASEARAPSDVLRVDGRARGGGALRWSDLLAIVLAGVLTACTRAYDVGDHVLVEWEGKDYPAMILDVPGPGKVKVHYDGYDEMWDEVVSRSRLKGRIEGPISNVPEPPEKVRRAAADASKNNKFKIGDRVTVEFHRHFYPAVIVGVVGPEKYRVHYEGYGNEWDENVGPDRMRSKTP